MYDVWSPTGRTNCQMMVSWSYGHLTSDDQKRFYLFDKGHEPTCKDRDNVDEVSLDFIHGVIKRSCETYKMDIIVFMHAPGEMCMYLGFMTMNTRASVWTSR